jgi:hypothetical protein
MTGSGGLCGNLNIHVGNASGCAVAENGELALASTWAIAAGWMHPGPTTTRNA